MMAQSKYLVSLIITLSVLVASLPMCLGTPLGVITFAAGIVTIGLCILFETIWLVRRRSHENLAQQLSVPTLGPYRSPDRIAPPKETSPPVPRFDRWLHRFLSHTVRAFAFLYEDKIEDLPTVVITREAIKTELLFCPAKLRGSGEKCTLPYGHGPTHEHWCDGSGVPTHLCASWSDEHCADRSYEDGFREGLRQNLLDRVILEYLDDEKGELADVEHKRRREDS